MATAAPSEELHEATSCLKSQYGPIAKKNEQII